MDFRSKGYIVQSRVLCNTVVLLESYTIPLVRLGNTAGSGASCGHIGKSRAAQEERPHLASGIGTTTWDRGRRRAADMMRCQERQSAATLATAQQAGSTPSTTWPHWARGAGAFLDPAGAYCTVHEFDEYYMHDYPDTINKY